MRVPALILILIFHLDMAFAQSQSDGGLGYEKGVEEKIAQKIKMVNLILHSPDMLQRVEASDDNVAKQLLSRAAENFLKGEEYFDRGQYLEAEAVLDYVLRDLSASSQLLSLPRQKKNQYAKFMEQLESFALPVWTNLDEQQNELLQQQLQRVSELRNQAARLAGDESFDEAINLLEQAYRQKVLLLDQFDHETTIVYDLKFETIQDEYQYMINRTYHYLDLVQMALSKSEIDEQTRKLTGDYLYRSMLNLENAENLEVQGQFSEAIPILDKSINQLSAVLKMLGINI